MVLALMLYKTYRESILGGCQSKRVGRRTHCTGGSNSNGIFCIDGFRPGRRDPFVSAKGPKTIDAPSGLIRGDGRKLAEADQLAGLKQGPAADKSVLPFGQPAGVTAGARQAHR